MNNAYLHCQFGKGIYTANNPVAFHAYGSICIFVACLKGTCVQWDDLGDNEILVMDGMHTVLGNKQKWSTSPNKVILHSLAQCLPLICYNHILLPTSDINVRSVLPKIEWSLQKVVNQILNCKNPFFNGSPSHVAIPSKHCSDVLAKVESILISRLSTSEQGMGELGFSWQAGKCPRALPISVLGVQQRSCLAEPTIKMVRATLPYHVHKGHVTVPVSGSTSEMLTYNAPNHLFQDKDNQYSIPGASAAAATASNVVVAILS